MKNYSKSDLAFDGKEGPTKNIRALKKGHCVICGRLIPLNVSGWKYCGETCKRVRNYVVEKGGEI